MTWVEIEKGLRKLDRTSVLRLLIEWCKVMNELNERWLIYTQNAVQWVIVEHNLRWSRKFPSPSVPAAEKTPFRLVIAVYHSRALLYSMTKADKKKLLLMYCSRTLK